jgi:hypothetical protein
MHTAETKAKGILSNEDSLLTLEESLELVKSETDPGKQFQKYIKFIKKENQRTNLIEYYQYFTPALINTPYHLQILKDAKEIADKKYYNSLMIEYNYHNNIPIKFESIDQLTQNGYLYLLKSVQKDHQPHSKKLVWKIYSLLKTENGINPEIVCIMLDLFLKFDSFKSFCLLYQKQTKTKEIDLAFIKGLAIFGGDSIAFNKAYGRLYQQGEDYSVLEAFIEYFANLGNFKPVFNRLQKLKVHEGEMVNSFDVDDFTLPIKDGGEKIQLNPSINDSTLPIKDGGEKFEHEFFNENDFMKTNQSKTKVPRDRESHLISFVFKACVHTNEIHSIIQLPYLFKKQHINQLIKYYDHFDDLSNRYVTELYLRNRDCVFDLDALKVVSFKFGRVGGLEEFVSVMKERLVPKFTESLLNDLKSDEDVEIGNDVDPKECLKEELIKSYLSGVCFEKEVNESELIKIVQDIRSDI